MGQYIYSVIECNEERTFNAVPIGNTPPLAREEGRGKREDKDVASIFHLPSSIVHRRGVYTISHNGLAAIVSDSEIKEYPITRENMLAHQKVNEAVMKEGFVVLSVRFCTIAESENLVIERLLDGKQDEIEEKLEYLADKNEYSLKVLWKEMPQVFSAIVEENIEIRRFKQRLEKMATVNRRDGMIEIGHMVKDALEAKKEVVGGVVYERLAKLAVEAKKNQLYGDKMPLNAAFLVAKDREKELDNEINKLAEENAGTMNWRYVGPTPAANFVEIVITWDSA